MGMGMKHTPEQIANLLRQIDAAIASGKTKSAASNETGITVQTYYRWRRECCSPEPDQSRRLKELEQENERLKLLVADLSLEKQLLQEIARGSFRVEDKHVS
jgi:cell division protein FtsB